MLQYLTGSSFVCVCVAMVCSLAHMVSFGGLFHFSCSVVDYILCFSVFLGRCDRVAGHVPHIDRVLLGVRGCRSKVTGVCPAPFKTKPGFQAQGYCVREELYVTYGI